MDSIIGFLNAFHLLYAGREGHMSNGTNLMSKLLNTGQRVSAKSGSLSMVCVQLGQRKLSVIRSSGVSAIEGLLKY